MVRENLSERKAPIAPPPHRTANSSSVRTKRPTAPPTRSAVPVLEVESFPVIQTDRPVAPNKLSERRTSHEHEPVIAPPGQGVPKKTDRDTHSKAKTERVLNTVAEEAESDCDDEMEHVSLIDRLREIVIEDGPSWLISSVVHTSIVLILWLIAVQVQPKDPGIETTWSEHLGEFNLEFDDAPSIDIEIFEPAIPTLSSELVDDPYAELPPFIEEAIRNPTTPVTFDPQPAPPGDAPTGLEDGRREEILAGGGGNRHTEEAVLLALAWLARNQGSDGSWSLTGPYPNGGKTENKVAATAMALLAFQGHRDTTVGGEYSENVRRGWDWLLQQQSSDGKFIPLGIKHNHPYYTHAQVTIALCELLHMSHDETYREPAENAVRLLLRDQSPLGGWKYSPGVDSDVSVTGWCVMALQSARMAGIEVPEDNLNRISSFLDSVSFEGGAKYSYQVRMHPTRIMTAEGLLCREYQGWLRTDKRLLAGADYLVEPENLVSYSDGERDVYYWYYAAQTLHHLGGDHWTRWNNVMRQELPSHQTQTGRESGSWDPNRPSKDAWAEEGGRLYVTCLSTYCLEVYYRHMPLYWNVYSVLPSLETTTVPTFRDSEDE